MTDFPCTYENSLAMALTYVDFGYRVFPLTPGTKTPVAGTSGNLSATDDKATVAALWEAARRKYPHDDADPVSLGVGVVVPSTALCIDIDDESRAADWAGAEGFAPTYEHTTLSGGRHLWYRVDDLPTRGPAGETETAWRAKFSGGDLRGDGRGYIAAFPTMAVPKGQRTLQQIPFGVPDLNDPSNGLAPLPTRFARTCRLVAPDALSPAKLDVNERQVTHESVIADISDAVAERRQKVGALTDTYVDELAKAFAATLVEGQKRHQFKAFGGWLYQNGVSLEDAQKICDATIAEARELGAHIQNDRNAWSAMSWTWERGWQHGYNAMLEMCDAEALQRLEGIMPLNRFKLKPVAGEHLSLAEIQRRAEAEVARVRAERERLTHVQAAPPAAPPAAPQAAPTVVNTPAHLLPEYQDDEDEYEALYDAMTGTSTDLSEGVSYVTPAIDPGDYWPAAYGCFPLDAGESVPSLVEGLDVAVGHTIAIAGAPSSGKTPFALQLSMCLANGQPFLGRQTVKTPVLYLVAEKPVKTGIVARRIARALDLPHDRRRGEIGGVMLASFTGSLKDPDVRVRLQALMLDFSQRHDEGVIIIDTLTALTGGIDRNTGEYADAVYALTSAVQQNCKNVCLMPLLHLRKIGPSRRPTLEDVSGSGGVAGALDGMIGIWAPDSARKRETKVACVREAVQDFDDFAIEVKSVTDPARVLPDASLGAMLGTVKDERPWAERRLAPTVDETWGMLVDNREEPPEEEPAKKGRDRPNAKPVEGMLQREWLTEATARYKSLSPGPGGVAMSAMGRLLPPERVCNDHERATTPIADKPFARLRTMKIILRDPETDPYGARRG